MIGKTRTPVLIRIFEKNFVFIFGLRSKSERRIYARAMHGFVTTRRPASAFRQAVGVVRATDVNSSAAELLEMAFQTKI